ncbi:NUDIX hydrolase [Pseudomonas sp. EA_35y_Pfl2_R5]|uniref:NUDIX hydrolase n=1 Tax=Pseudomonas sp. EA_35y_Pfl2_R5 TaxID=3088690 RepID=UPI0030DD094E
MSLKEKNKVVIYVISREHLLAFYHADYPEVGYQVPAGTVESGEDPLEAARRELLEEAGLDLPPERFTLLGCESHDMRPFKCELHFRSYFYVKADEAFLDTWTHHELHAGTQNECSPTKFCYEWISTKYDIKNLLSVGQGRFVDRILGVGAGSIPFQRKEYVAINSKLSKFRADRISHIRELLSLLPKNYIAENDISMWGEVRKGRYSALEQAFYSITKGIEHHEDEQLSFGASLLKFLPQVSNETIHVSLHSKQRVYSSEFESPPYVSTFNIVDRVGDQKIKNMLQAIEVCISHGFGDTVESQVGNICILQEKDLLSATDSYTLSGLPSTIYCDYIENTYRLAEIILHEATHNWLNEALRAYEIKLDQNKEFYSPWRKKFRPAVGILHAALVFSRLIGFFEVLIARDELAEYELVYFTRKLESEKLVIMENIEMLSEVLGMLEQAPAIKCVIAEEINRVINFY